MEFELTIIHNGVTVQLSAIDAPNLKELNAFLNSLTEKAIQEITPQVTKKRRGRPVGSKNKAK